MMLIAEKGSRDYVRRFLSEHNRLEFHRAAVINPGSNIVPDLARRIIISMTWCLRRGRVPRGWHFVTRDRCRNVSSYATTSR